MNVEFFKEFGRTNPTLPLKEAGKIVQGNATRLDWEEVCPKTKESEIYILGNPPYLGSKEQNIVQKQDIQLVFNDWKIFKKLDYIAIWFKLGMDFIQNSNSKFAFVSTNSITMGEQVSILWPYLSLKDEERFFAYKSFKWENNAKNKAGVTVVIIGIQNRIKSYNKYLYETNQKIKVDNISPYLTNSKDLIIYPRRFTISDLPIMERGSQPTDNGNLIFSEEEYKTFLSLNPDSEVFFKKFMGADDLLNGKKRFCLWLKDINEWEQYPEIVSRVERCENFRLNSKKVGTQKKASTPHLFDEIKHKEHSSIIFPVITSEKRKYIPIDFLDKNTVISNKGQVVYNATPWIFGLLTSRIHNIWIQAVAGRMETRIQYSNTICTLYINIFSFCFHLSSF
jgi:hypothetical protein